MYRYSTGRRKPLAVRTQPYRFDRFLCFRDGDDSAAIDINYREYTTRLMPTADGQ